MHFIHFPEANKHLGPPPGMTEAECGTLPVFTDGRTCVSCWRPTPEDLAVLNAGGVLYLGVLSGATQPPVFLQVDNPIGPLPVPEFTPEVEKSLRFIAERLPAPETREAGLLSMAALLAKYPDLPHAKGEAYDPTQHYFVTGEGVREHHYQQMRAAWLAEGQPGVVKYLQPYAEFLPTEVHPMPHE